jgi:uncharacterized protein YdcH (DUF465 family)
VDPTGNGRSGDLRPKKAYIRRAAIRYASHRLDAAVCPGDEPGGLGSPTTEARMGLGKTGLVLEAHLGGGYMKQQVLSPRVDINPEERLNFVEARHRELDARLKELGRHPYLTPAEQIEAAELKKWKLLAKDEMVALRRRLAPAC